MGIESLGGAMSYLQEGELANIETVNSITENLGNSVRGLQEGELVSVNPLSLLTESILGDPMKGLNGGEFINLEAGNSSNSFDMIDNFMHINSTTSKMHFHGASDVAISAVITALWFNITLFLAVMGIYEIFFRMFPSVYRRNRNSEVVLPKSFLPLSWIPAILRVSSSQVRKLCGMDAYFFLRYIRLCFQICVVTGVYGAIILWPVYATGGNGAVGWYHLSMANLENQSLRLWFPTVFMYFMTLYVYFLINEEYKHYVECRMEFLTKGDLHVNPQQRYSLMVQQIPHELRSDQALCDYFEQLFPNRVHSACLVLHLPGLTELCARRERVVRRLEKCMMVQEITGRRPFHKVGIHKYMDVARRINLYENDPRLAQPGEKADSINYYSKYLDVLNEKLGEQRREKLKLAELGEKSPRASQWIESLGLGRPSTEDCDILTMTSDENMNVNSRLLFLIKRLGCDFMCGGLSNLNRPLDTVVDTMVGRTHTSNGFVTFTDLVTVTCAVRAPLTHEAGVFSVQMAPDSRDIVWTNAHIDKAWSSGREGMTDVLLGIGAILWSVPVTFIQALANLESLAEIPGLKWIDDVISRDSAAFLNGYLPIIALMGLIASLPLMLSWVALSFERRISKSDIQHSVIKRFFYYQLANVYITVTAGSILDTLSDILDHPRNVFTLLGTSVPAVVGYFVMFILTKLLAALPLTLLQILPIMNHLTDIMCCRANIKVQREHDLKQTSQKLDLGREYPNQFLVIVIVFTYATISPIILPVASVYFLAAYIVFKKQLLLVYSSTFESGGIFFPTACNRTLVGLLAAQCTLIGYTILRLGFYQPLALLPLPFYTIRVMRNFRNLYEEPGHYLSLERAVNLDKYATNVGGKDHSGANDPTKCFDENVYRQPNLIHDILKPLPVHSSAPASEDVDYFASVPGKVV